MHQEMPKKRVFKKGTEYLISPAAALDKREKNIERPKPSQYWKSVVMIFTMSATTSWWWMRQQKRNTR